MQIQFFGATQYVTGSCFLITCGDQRILVECGMRQGSHHEADFNFHPFPFNPKSLSAVIITHAHMDHSGLLPKLVHGGYEGPIYTHRATRDLCRIMLLDSASIQEKDAESLNRKRLRKHLSQVTPLYTAGDVENTMRLFDPMHYGERRTIAPGVAMRLSDAGHILGSAILELWLTEGAVTKKLVFSGDLGHQGAPILKEPTLISEADWIFMETTYGDRNHRSWADTFEELRAAFASAHREQGNILIPAFTIGRTQELLYFFKEHHREWGLDQWKIYLDSPMAIEATAVYAKHINEYDDETKAMIAKIGSPYALPNLHLCRDVSESMALNRIDHGAIIIAGNGMCTGGRILHHLKYNVWRPNCHIIIIGFQTPGTIGRQLIEGVDSIHLYGERIKVAAQIHTIGGLSAHADQQGLINWLKHFQGQPKVVLIHGEADAMQSFEQVCQRECHFKVMRPAYGDIIELNHE